MNISAKLISQTLAEIAKVLKAGMTTFGIDQVAAEFIRNHKAVPSFLNNDGFPHNIRASVNDVVVHGLANHIPYKGR